jgi:hypothetical protein
MTARRPVRPATKHNALFGPGLNFHLNACVGRNGGPADFGRYARGYFAAGAVILKSLQENSMDVDILVYPLVTNYRHGVEDMLKQLAATISLLCTGKMEICYTHKLTDNWAIVRQYLPEIGVPQDEIDEAEAILKELLEIDPTGETFRYPFSNKGERHLEETSMINVETFGARIATLADPLEAWCGWAAQNLEWKAEMEAEMRGCYY